MNSDQTGFDLNTIEGIEAAKAFVSGQQPMAVQAAPVADPNEDTIISQIRSLELVNKELSEDVDPDIVLPTVPDNPPKAKLAALREINQILVDQINSEEQTEAEDRPKFGDVNGPLMPIEIKTDPFVIHVDRDGIDVYTGQRYTLSEKQKRDFDKIWAKGRADDLVREFDESRQTHNIYAMTEEEFNLESEKQFPVYLLRKQPGPEWDDSILYGDAGRVIHKASQYCEAHPAGMLVDFLVSFGSIIGRGPYFNVGETRHYTNEYMCRVGISSKARKGTGRDAIDGLLKLIDPAWYSNRVESGFGSGEAIVDRIRDTRVETRQQRLGSFVPITVPGVDDKRLMIREGELASIFVLAGKADSRADIIIRDGWDGKALRNIVKGKSRDGFSNSAKCEEPHLCISGDTTVAELRQKMPTGADNNGFGNRFLYVYVYSTKHCPQGGPTIDWSKEVVEFWEVVKFARIVKHVSMTPAARKRWNRKYPELENEGPDGLAGKMTARAAAHVRRLAMIYALIDMTDEIDIEHLEAAEKLWRYCEESSIYIFGGMTKEQQRIVQWVGMKGTATYREIVDDLYNRHRPTALIRADLESLVAGKHLFVRSGVYATGQNVRLIA